MTAWAARSDRPDEAGLSGRFVSGREVFELVPQRPPGVWLQIGRRLLELVSRRDEGELRRGGSVGFADDMTAVVEPWSPQRERPRPGRGREDRPAGGGGRAQVLMLSWEFPPRVVGGLARHVHRLSGTLAEAGHRVCVATAEHPDAPPEELVGGVHVLRAGGSPPLQPLEDLVAWVLRFNVALLARSMELVSEAPVDLVHAHDWHVAPAAVALKHLLGLPLVATIHATESGRHQGQLPNPMSELIHRMEEWLAQEARRTITCSEYMREEVQRLFRLPPDKQLVIPNGADVSELASPQALADYRAARCAEGEKLLVFAGRLEFEKGVQTALEALPLLLEVMPARLYIAGTGTYAEALEAKTAELGLSDRVHFLGFVPTEELSRLYAAAHLVLVPSLYEPQGLVALEAMAAGTPCIAADSGGLRDIVIQGQTGLRFAPGDPLSLFRAALQPLGDDSLRQRLARDARRMIEQRFAWAQIADETARVYERVVAAARPWSSRMPWPAGAPAPGP